MAPTTRNLARANQNARAVTPGEILKERRARGTRERKTCAPVARGAEGRAPGQELVEEAERTPEHIASEVSKPVVCTEKNGADGSCTSAV
jgi:hypothetical protein